jgi:hypothetical protein
MGPHSQRPGPNDPAEDSAIWAYIHTYIGHTQKNGAVSKVNKKCVSHLTWANVHYQQRQLSKFLMRYQQFASHAEHT